MKKILIVILLVLVVAAGAAAVTHLSKTSAAKPSSAAAADRPEVLEPLTAFEVGDTFYATGGVMFNHASNKYVLNYLKSLSYQELEVDGEDESSRSFCNIISCDYSNSDLGIGLLYAAKYNDVYMLCTSGGPVWSSAPLEGMHIESSGWQIGANVVSHFVSIDGGYATVTAVEQTQNGKLFGSVNANETECAVTFSGFDYCSYDFSGTRMYESCSYSVLISPQNGFVVSDVVVVGTCDASTFDSSTGYLSIVHPKSDLTISVSTQAITYEVISSIAHGYATVHSGELSILSDIEIEIIPDDGYTYPSEVTVLGSSSSYDATNGIVTISAATNDVFLNAECPEASQEPEVVETPSNMLTAFEINDDIEASDYIVFDNSISDADMLSFCQGLTYSDGTCNLVADDQQSNGFVIVVNFDSWYGLLISDNGTMYGWFSDANVGMGIAEGGWNVPSDGRVLLSGNVGTVGFLNSAAGWNGTIVGFEKGQPSPENF